MLHRNPKTQSLTRIAIALVLTLMAGLADGQAHAQGYRVPGSKDEIRLTFAPVVKATAPAVVNVFATRRVQQQSRLPSIFDDPFFRRFFDAPGLGAPRERLQNALGSGVIVDRGGLVVTNNHVIEGADEVRVVLSDRREFAAEIVLKDERTDLAVLRLENAPVDLPTIAFSSADALEVGDLVLAIGNPFGVGQTVTSGIVSAVARTQAGINDMGFFIQTDAAINPGNSGGALVDMDGRLVGINTAIFSRKGGGSIGIGFAIPSEMVQFVVASAANGGKVQRPWFGGQLQGVTAEIAATLGLGRPVGVLVSGLSRRGPAAQGGLRIGDVIVAVDGREIADPQSFRYRFATRGIGGTSRLKVLRDGRERDIAIALVAAPEDPPRDTRLIRAASPLAGLQVANLSPIVAEELGMDEAEEGVVVVGVASRSPAARAGFKPGDIVRAVNGRDITSTKALEKASQADVRVWRLTVERGGRKTTLVFSG
ncbi:MAG: Do family serine endopeptidase [Rhodobiaceae bacterium]|nr:Do family serine endopeptidase [Rhodobiaceae bacterium]MCC0052463.1 Do family serine endopeptidase [Rhodobiaceae bacterium]